MSEHEWILSTKKEKRSVRPVRAAYYERAQIVEAVRRHHMYYIFFYKGSYVTAIQAGRVKRHSFLARAFQKGLVLDAPHPLLHRLNRETPFPTATYTSFIRHLAGTYSRQEQAYILTFLESFLPKKKLLQEMKTLFYEVRRQGKMFQAYRIIRILMDFAPHQRFVQELSHDLTFQTFEDVYNRPAEELWEKDQIQAARKFFHERNASFLPFLKEESPLEYTAFLLLLLSENRNPGYDLPKDMFSEEENLQILEHLNHTPAATGEVKQELLTTYINRKDLSRAYQLLTEKNLTEEESVQVKQILADDPSLLTDVRMWERYLEEIFRHTPEAKEEMLPLFVRATLPYGSFDEIQATVDAFSGEGGTTYEKVKHMGEWQDDLDHMQDLGVLYYEFGGKEKALECFHYAAEMHPESVEPLQWMTKVYKDLGQEKEAETYTNLTKQMQKSSL